ncbi:MAG TPA: outer membrane protein [Xanthobacteraceae bacterium]|jgi:outer membrane immunogenic protein
MRTLLFAVALLLAISGAALGADRAVRPLPARIPADTSIYMGWTGFYVGVNAGGGIANDRSNFSSAGVLPFASVNDYLTGAIGGGQAGFNWQYGVTVLGAEADIQAAGLKGGIATPCSGGLCAVPVTASYNQSVPWFGTVRGRLGLAWSCWLMYATGGYAYARVETDAVAAAGPAFATFSLHETRNGWTAGSGIEVAFAPGWSAKLEYLYLDFGNRSSALTLPPPPIIDDAHFTMNVVRAGANYRF